MTPQELEHHMDAIYARSFRLLRDEDMAWDVLQEVMMRFYEACQRQEIRQPLHYLYRSCTNHCIRAMKQHRRYVPLEAEDLEQLIGSHSQEADNRLLVESLLELLEQEDVHLLVYRYCDQMTLSEIAKLYGMSDRGIKKRLEKLELKLQKHLRKGKS